jgi:hypothetical protein
MSINQDPSEHTETAEYLPLILAGLAFLFAVMGLVIPLPFSYWLDAQVRERFPDIPGSAARFNVLFAAVSPIVLNVLAWSTANRRIRTYSEGSSNEPHRTVYLARSLGIAGLFWSTWWAAALFKATMRSP